MDEFKPFGSESQTEENHTETNVSPAIAENVQPETPASPAQPVDAPAPLQPAKVAQKKKKSMGQEIKEWVVALAVALVIVFVINTFLFRIIRVEGHSMDTTLADGERLFVSVPDIKFGSVERNIVVICRYPGRGRTFFVKRCVAIPGDTVYRENGVTHVVAADTGEDVALDERYAAYFPFGSPEDYAPYTLGEDEYFVVGDNRYNSHDSRDWNDSDDSSDVGPISKSMIVGRVREVIWPLGSIRSVD